MAKRIKIGIIYSYDEGWIAGAYYISNLIHSLNLLEDEIKPELLILSYSKEEFDSVCKLTKYPYLKFKQLDKNDIWGSNYNLFERLVNKVYRVFLRKNFVTREQTRKRLKVDVDFLFPAEDHIYFSKIKKKIFWIPDFQEHFLPQLFTEDLINRRKKYQQKLVEGGYPIVFSSYNALEHFDKIYPKSKSKTFVLQFAVTHPPFENVNIASLLKKFDISKPYFFCPNQFWAHKNHMVVLKALACLKEKGITDILIVFSGKENDPRNPHYFTSLKKYVEENKIEDQVRFLGFIDRAEQLQIMNNAISVIQPSQFEGWSTTIEDAKSMGQFVIACDLGVNIEQLKQNALFFDSEDYQKLAEILKNFQLMPPEKILLNYKENNKNFGRTFFNILEQI
jgi:glycosyltransferase involved in cell wall biosynthesis